MASLYEITSKFNELFNEIEENDGEVTSGIEEALAITQENYKEKLENYTMVIRDYESDIVVLKAETERLNTRKKVIENRIERLKQRVLDAVLQFGPVETAKFKIGTRKSKVVNIDDNRTQILKRAMFKFAEDIYANGVLAFGENCDIHGILDVVNANVKAQYNIPDEEFVPFTLNDLNVFRVNINSSSNLIDLFTRKDGLLEAFLTNQARFNCDNEISKTELKNELSMFDDITIGNIDEKVNLSIR